MSSITQKTEKRRALRAKATGKQKKKARAKQGTPPFAIDPAQAGPDSVEKKPAAK